jgi:hypothetical protein
MLKSAARVPSGCWALQTPINNNNDATKKYSFFISGDFYIILLKYKKKGKKGKIVKL